MDNFIVYTILMWLFWRLLSYISGRKSQNPAGDALAKIKENQAKGNTNNKTINQNSHG